MSNWNQMLRNKQKTGGFCGQTTSEQDAYYQFFADDTGLFPKPVRFKKWYVRVAAFVVQMAYLLFGGSTGTVRQRTRRSRDTVMAKYDGA
ncbi:hypothetical protein [uncultured Roseibium sp.]|uniref:hypothetical protein n=1 Tax=uncultured Roseibium sp. TaxID=1936171 RepID=UPI0026177390|nr:hypothetical protein [uncultured Roseibium sp.]